MSPFGEVLALDPEEGAVDQRPKIAGMVWPHALSYDRLSGLVLPNSRRIHCQLTLHVPLSDSGRQFVPSVRGVVAVRER
jgi:hypothetical protein